MLAYARHLSTVERLRIRFKRADMRAFALAERRYRPMLVRLVQPHDRRRRRRELRRRARLAQGRRPAPRADAPADYFATTSTRTVGRWTVHPDVTVWTRFLTKGIDPIAETYVKSMTIDATYKDRRPSKHIVDRQMHRMWLRSGISHVAAASGAFDIVGWYGDLSPRVPLSLRMSSLRMVTVLRRRN